MELILYILMFNILIFVGGIALLSYRIGLHNGSPANIKNNPTQPRPSIDPAPQSPKKK